MLEGKRASPFEMCAIAYLEEMGGYPFPPSRVSSLYKRQQLPFKTKPKLQSKLVPKHKQLFLPHSFSSSHTTMADYESWEQQNGARNNGSEYGFWARPPSPPRYQPETPQPKPKPIPPTIGYNPFSDIVPSVLPPGLDPKVAAAFQMADRDGNGFIDEKEMKVALQSCGLNFNTRAIRLMMNTFSNTRNRMMGPKEFAAVWSGLQAWKGSFQRFDRDRNGKIDSSELKQALGDLGYPLSSYVLNGFIFMFDKNGGSKMGIGFESFIECCLTVKGLTEKFKLKDTEKNGKATFEYEEFMLAVLPFIVAQ